MSYDTARLVVNPTFIDALGGEFTPASDPDRQHTLGRLLVATFQKGELSQPAWDAIGGLAYDLAYHPSWASNVISRITCLEQSEWSTVTGLWLRKTGLDGAYERVGIMDHNSRRSDAGHLRLLEPGQLGTGTEFALDLGPQINQAREAVTKAAQKFFS